MNSRWLAHARRGVVVGAALVGAVGCLAAEPAATPATGAASSAQRVSPYAIAARQHAMAASGARKVAAVPPSMKRTRAQVSQVPTQ